MTYGASKGIPRRLWKVKVY